MNADDPKLTAYALGELDPAEREDIAKMLRGDPAAAAEMEATRACAAGLRTRLKAECAAGLHPGQRAEVSGRIESVSRRNVIVISHRATGLAALAASAVAGAGLALMLPGLYSMKSARQNPASARAEATTPAPRDGSEVRVSLAIERAQTSGESLQLQDVAATGDSTAAARYSALAFGLRTLPSPLPGFGTARISLENFQQFLPRDSDGALHASVLPDSLNDFAMPLPPAAAPAKPARRSGREESVKQRIGSPPPPGRVRAWIGERTAP